MAAKKKPVPRGDRSVEKNIEVLDRIPVVNGRVTLSASTFPELQLRDLLTDWFGGGVIEIEQASQREDPDHRRVVVSGQSSCFGVQHMTTEATLTLPAEPSGAAFLQIRFQLSTGSAAAGWRFRDSFAALPEATRGAADSPLDQLILEQPVLILATAPGQDEVTGATLVRGLNFVGTAAGVSLAGLPLPVASGTPITGELTPERVGVITPRRPVQQFPWDISTWPVPGIRLILTLGASAQLGPVALRNPALRVYSPLTSSWAKQNRSYRPAVGLTAEVLIGPDIGVHVTAELADQGQFFLEGAADNLSLASLAELTGIAGNGDMLSGLPDAVRDAVAIATELQLESISLAGTLVEGQFQLNIAAMRIGYRQLHWKIFDTPSLEVGSVSVEFTVLDPLGASRSVSACVIGELSFGGVDLDLYTTVPDFSVLATLRDGATVPLHQAFSSLHLPAPPDLRIDTLEMYVVPGHSYNLACTLANAPGWLIDLGFLKPTIQAVNIEISKASDQPVSAAFSGVIIPWEGVVLNVAYTVPGSFQASAQLPTIRLSDLWRKLSDIGIDLPFPDITLDQPYAAITTQNGGYTFSATTLIEGFGELALSSRKTGGGTGLAAAISVPDAQSESLGFIGELLAAVDLRKLVLVISSLTDPGFDFPELAAFNAPTFRGTGVTLPASVNGVVKGVNLYALLGTANDRGLGALFKLFGVDVDGTLGVTVSISAPDPKADSKLSLSFVSETAGLNFDGELGIWLSDAVLGAFLAATATTSIQGTPLTFKAAAAVFETGILISGTIEGTVDFGPVHLTDLALTLGVDWDGIPSAGFAAQINVFTFDSSVAIFFDSLNPAQSMFAGAVSDITLAQIVSVFTVGSIPSELQEPLSYIGLRGLEGFNVPADPLTTALDEQDHAAVSGVLNPCGLSLGASPDSFHIIVGEAGRQWFIASRSRDRQGRPLPHYELSRDGEEITCKLEPQIYFSPQDTMIGSLQFDQGCYLVAEIDSVLLRAQIDINVDPSAGISADVDIDRIVLFDADFFALTGTSGENGPHLSFATYSRPGQADPTREGPHFSLDGRLHMLGIDVSSTKLTLGKSGLVFEFTQNGAFGGLSLSGEIDAHRPEMMHASGTVSFGFDKELSVGSLPSLHVQTILSGNLTVALNGGHPSLALLADFKFMGLDVALPELTVSTSFLGDIPDLIADAVGEAIVDRLKSMLGALGGAVAVAEVLAEGFGQQLKDVLPLLKNLGASAGAMAEAISGVYHLDPGQVASALLNLVGLSVEQVGVALQVGLHMTADGVAAALHAAGVATEQIAGVLRSGFGYSADAVAGVLEQIGLPGDEIAAGLKGVFNLSVDEMASVLKNVLDLGADGTRTLLEEAGYAADAIESGLSSAFDWAEDKLNWSNW